MMTFSITARDSETAARTGLLSLPHGTVPTPQFMPVGTNGTVKAISHALLEETGIGLILGNTYHLYLRPGLEVIRVAGGLHRFSSWTHNILTDSGGYQVFSLAPFRKIEQGGVSFRSHIDGSSHFLTPEAVVDIQQVLGSDVMMTLDVCTPPGIDYRKAIEAMEITSLWARRSVEHARERYPESSGSLFAIVQGNFFEDLRARSASEITELDLPGFAIGGLSVGEPFSQFNDMLAYTAPLLPEGKPRYLMGVGTPEYIFAAVENGIDLFDCVFPTRIARNGSVFTHRGVLNLKREDNRLSMAPLDERCGCPVCSTYSRAYIRHLFKAKEILAAMLATHHNLYFMRRLLDEIRESIASGRFLQYKRAFLQSYQETEV